MVLGGLGDGHGKEKNPVQAVNTFVCRSSQVHFRVLKQMSFKNHDTESGPNFKKCEDFFTWKTWAKPKWSGDPIWAVEPSGPIRMSTPHASQEAQPSVVEIATTWVDR
jgi:hypothetical protein